MEPDFNPAQTNTRRAMRRSACEDGLRVLSATDFRQRDMHRTRIANANYDACRIFTIAEMPEPQWFLMHCENFLTKLHFLG
ncbi:hypothetical protein GJW-30_1_00676 [Variibacter gotjawalensis]|uniref:Uncharacterized protein n=1 Tax=Variibacter gotjawalensis TaxID=1333996 RepID=A0A0S3PQD7_9BRAD|nr:putative ATP-grasp superfamily ATP-dependent carboligase [Variibacter gotjawalensis]RZS50322.1 hypothetical protein EV661_2784 [Variibacter gotjawalensis]BAT58155.1 hypothetical protein GJW-30_1_00676 [Variibacter gotjawalensis]